MLVTMRGSNLPLLVIFKGKPGGRIEKSVDEFFLMAFLDACNEKDGWIT